MFIVKTLTLCIATAITAGGLVLMSPHASARQRPIIVTAPPSEDIVVRRVSYADLNLASQVGERKLHSRVKYAVGSLCTETTGGSNIGGLFATIAMSRCSQASWNQAEPQIDRAINRAREIASTGSSSIAATAITISLAN